MHRRKITIIEILLLVRARKRPFEFGVELGGEGMFSHS